MVHAETRALGAIGLDAGHRGQAEHEPGRAGPLGPGHQLPGIGEHHHRPRPGHPHRGASCSKCATSARPPSTKSARSWPTSACGWECGCRPPPPRSCRIRDWRRANGDRRTNPKPTLTDATTMRHRRRGRKLGRNPNHQRALLRNLASALILTERDAEGDENKPQGQGPDHHHAPEGQGSPPAGRALHHHRLPRPAAPGGRRRIWSPTPSATASSGGPGGSSERWQEWNQAIAPVVAARRRVLRLLGDKQAVRILFERHRPALRRPPRRLHPRAPPGQAPAGRRRHPGDPRVGRRRNDRVRRKAARPSSRPTSRSQAARAGRAPPRRGTGRCRPLKRAA